ncbi:hypothetical protein [Muriicola jejuensis]|uniref:Uncharacterized protein n=1 Tax=Muriicola jejuensis TaxID=504488 RepID=A0A6P0UNA3_9FLAO|nr:hypothetical protein [Muriicola jejuensis]NER11786.1 hypothetical protein [Muriicola jejuensis]
MKFKSFLFVLLSLLLFSCSKYSPRFERSFLSVLSDLEEISSAESAKVGYTKRYFSGETQHFLVVTLSNSMNLPENETELKKLGMKAMKFVFENIDNETIYDGYEVVFENQKGNLITQTFKSRFVYSYEEIEQ